LRIENDYAADQNKEDDERIKYLPAGLDGHTMVIIAPGRGEFKKSGAKPDFLVIPRRSLAVSQVGGCNGNPRIAALLPSL
jgi:hypothetical protein